MDNERQRWNKGRTFLLVTGASRGLGQAFATSLSKRLGAKDDEDEDDNRSLSVVYLTARSEEGLSRTRAEILRLDDDDDDDRRSRRLRRSLRVETFVLDQERADRDGYAAVLGRLDRPEEFDSAVIVHNAGDLGRPQGRTVIDQDDADGELTRYFRSNVVSVAILNSVFARTFPRARKTVINVSSLAALRPFPTWGTYCSGKAARDAMFRVMALEEREREEANHADGDDAATTTGRATVVLSYAPGPVRTAMTEGVVRDEKAHDGLRKSFREMIENQTMLEPEQSAEKLVRVLDENAFESGDHVDYYD